MSPFKYRSKRQAKNNQTSIDLRGETNLYSKIEAARYQYIHISEPVTLWRPILSGLRPFITRPRTPSPVTKPSDSMASALPGTRPISTLEEPVCRSSKLVLLMRYRTANSILLPSRGKAEPSPLTSVRLYSSAIVNRSWDEDVKVWCMSGKQEARIQSIFGLLLRHPKLWPFNPP